MKRFCKTVAVVLASALAVLPLWACGAIERKNLMSITAVTQHADGAIYAQMDFGATEFKSDVYYELQFSINGGSSWAKVPSMQISDDSVKDIPVATYDMNTDSYYWGASFGPDNIVTINAGDELDITMRLMGNGTYKTSGQSNTVHYTVKPLSKVGADFPDVDRYSRGYQQVSSGGKEGNYTFEKQPDNSFKLRRMVYVAEENGEFIHADLLPEDMGLFEYKFYTFAANTNGNRDYKESYYYSLWDGKEENERETSGWIDYNAETGITYATCSANAQTVYYLSRAYDDDGNVTFEVWQRCSMVPLLFRYKGTDTALRSIVKPVHLLLTDWVDMPASMA